VFAFTPPANGFNSMAPSIFTRNPQDPFLPRRRRRTEASHLPPHPAARFRVPSCRNQGRPASQPHRLDGAALSRSVSSSPLAVHSSPNRDLSSASHPRRRRPNAAGLDASAHTRALYPSTSIAALTNQVNPCKQRRLTCCLPRRNW
jgi:hypothetical protein